MLSSPLLCGKQSKFKVAFKLLKTEEERRKFQVRNFESSQSF